MDSVLRLVMTYMITTDKPILCIDFGTTNSSACWVQDGRITVIPLEGNNPIIPSAIFFSAEKLGVVYGTAAIDEYKLETNGRLMKSLKSVLGSRLINESTAVRGGLIQHRRVIELFLSHIKEKAESFMGSSVEQVILGRPVHFVNDDEERDKYAEVTLRRIANAIGFNAVSFQYEPIAAALDYEVGLNEDKIVLIVDIGGGTSDFSLLHLGPSFKGEENRAKSVIGTAGIHIAGTDFDYYLSLRSAMKTLGFGATGKFGRVLPGNVYSVLSTWHEINTLYNKVEISRVKEMRSEFADVKMHERLMRALQNRLGHRIIDAVEVAKIGVSEGGDVQIDLDFVESKLVSYLSESILSDALMVCIEKIVACAGQLVNNSGIKKSDITAIYFTGGSTSIRYLRRQFQNKFPTSEVLVGEKFVSVSQGLGVSALNQSWIAA